MDIDSTIESAVSLLRAKRYPEASDAISAVKHRCEYSTCEYCFKINALQIEIKIKNKHDLLGIEEDRLLKHFLDKYTHFNGTDIYINLKYLYLKHQLILFSRSSNQIGQYDALKEMVNTIVTNRHIFSFLNINRVKIWKSQLKELEAKISQNNGDNLVTVADLYKQAAISIKPTVKDQFTNDMLFKHYELLSISYKVLAFNIIKNNGSYVEVEKYFAMSKNEASKGCDIYEDNRGENHYNYLLYWHSIFAGRNSLGRKDINKALRDFNIAIEAANVLDKHHIKFMPNYFSDIAELKNQIKLVMAYKELLCKNFNESKELLSQWLHESKNQKGWKYNSIKVRLNAVQLCEFAFHVEDINKNDLVAIKTGMNEAFEGVRLGNATSRIRDSVLLFLSSVSKYGQESEEAIKLYNDVVDLFPLDTQATVDDVSDHLMLTTGPTLDSMPEYFSIQLVKLKTAINITDLAARSEEVLKNYFTIIADYYTQKCNHFLNSDWLQERRDISPGFTIIDPLEIQDLKELILYVMGITKLIGKEHQESITIFVKYSEILSEGYDSTDENELLKLVRKLIETSASIYFPHVIYIEALDETFFTARRCWQKLGFRKILLDTSWPVTQGEYYYLRPKYNNLNFERLANFRQETEVYKARFNFETFYSGDSNKELKIRYGWQSTFLSKHLDSLSSIIDSEVSEKDIKTLLCNNIWMFGGHKQFMREQDIDPKHKPDMIIETYHREYVIVEVKLPSANLLYKDVRRSNLLHEVISSSRDLEQAITQVQGYQSALQRYLSTNNISTSLPNAILVIGRRSSEFNSLKAEKKVFWDRCNLSIWTYDDLIEQAKGFLDSIQSNLE